MRQYIAFALIVIGASVAGYFVYASHVSVPSERPEGYCEQDSDCPTIYCIRAPCPQSVCEDNSCRTALPREPDCRGDAACFYGNVTRIVDGDTIDVDGARVRLAIVNTPEVDEPGYQEAKDFIGRACPVGSEVLVDEDDGQRGGSYGRTIAEVRCGDVNLNEALLENKLAAVDFLVCDRSEFADEEWSDSHGC